MTRDDFSSDSFVGISWALTKFPTKTVNNSMSVNSQRPKTASQVSRLQSRQRDNGMVIPYRNLLLASLPTRDSQELIEASTPVRLNTGDTIYEAGNEISFTLFPISCVVAVNALLKDGSIVEISMTGREGLVGMPAIVGGGRALHWTSVSAAGIALKLSGADLQKRFNESETLYQAILHSYRGLFTQICQVGLQRAAYAIAETFGVAADDARSPRIAGITIYSG